ncbi:MAG: ATP-dependent DNA ligase [Candidatus Caldarchaeum sp.]|uniref:DNA ligase n=1 Tax=Caldiarchaeum subterraneum TaxID=311458 RepID=A0A7C5QCB8_CALS0
MPEAFTALVELCENLERTSGKNDKIRLTAEFFQRFKSGSLQEAAAAAYLLVGFSSGVRRLGLNVGPSTLYKSLEGRQSSLTVSERLTIAEVYETLRKMEKLSGQGSYKTRVSLLAGLFSRASEPERKWLVRIISGETRHGLSVGLLLESLARVAGKPLETVKMADMFMGDLGELTKAALSDGLDSVGITILRPVKPMLADHAYTSEEVVKVLGTPVMCEPKIDGVRVQVHKKEGTIKVYSRGLKDLTSSLPDLENLAAEIDAEEAILDGEAYCVGENGRPLPFQTTMSRVGREKDVETALAEFKLQAKFFDILYVNGRNLCDNTLRQRRETLNRCLPEMLVNPMVEADNPHKVEECFMTWVSEGFEGLMAKSPNSPYVPGRIGRYWLKLKQAYTLDVVVVAAEWGHGRRRGWLSNYHLAVRDERTGEFVPVGKTFKGLTDDEFRKMTEMLLRITKQQTGWGVVVEPRIVLEVEYNEVQKSPHYSSGYALRFARVKRIRDDKEPSEADTLSKVEEAFLTRRKY